MPGAPPAYQDPLDAPLKVPPGPNVSPPTTRSMPAPNSVSSVPGMNPYAFLAPYVRPANEDRYGSTYIPVDSWVYPAALRLYSLGYLNTSFINMRPWTRRSLLHMLIDSQPDIVANGNPEALEIYSKLKAAIADETAGLQTARGTIYGVQSVYARALGISGQTLRDSYHLGQTINNDYGRPYEPGFNALLGFSTVNELGRFSLYVRGEYEHSPAGAGYPFATASELSNLDAIPFTGPNIPQATIPYLNTGEQNPFRLQEATLSFHLLGHEISGGKSDAWLGPAAGGAMGWSNNAEDIYSFRINRVEPLHIPVLSRLTGPFRYDFFVGSLKGHTDPNSPWIHSEAVAFAPTSNVRFEFQRAVIWGGEGHEPVTIHTFLRSFFSFDDTETDPADKNSPRDPGARYSAFNFSWRLPFMSHHVTLYSDSIVHDDVTPPSAPRRAAYRPGIYLSQVPGLRKLDFRAEAASTDTSTLRSMSGQFNYFEAIQKQGYTNKGFIMGDWIGREAKGGQAWLTYHLSGNEWVQLEYLNKKTPKDFIAGGTTQNQFKVEVVKRLRPNVELDAWLQYEGWKAPIYIPGNSALTSALNTDTAVMFQVTFFPTLHHEAGDLMPWSKRRDSTN